MSSLLMHVHTWDLPHPLYPSLSWCHPCIAPWPFSFFPFSPATRSLGMKPELGVVQPLPAPHSVWSFLLLLLFLSLDLRTPQFQQSWCVFVLIIFLSSLGPDVPLTSGPSKTSVCCHEWCSVTVISWRGVLWISVVGLWTEAMREKGRNLW